MFIHLISTDWFMEKKIPENTKISWEDRWFPVEMFPFLTNPLMVDLLFERN